MTTITAEQCRVLSDYVEDEQLASMLKSAGITVEEPPYVPSKPGEFFQDKDGDVWEVSTYNPSRAHLVSEATDIDYLQEHYGPLKSYVLDV